jgi:gluconate 2-dehydrogenase gamma chain
MGSRREVLRKRTSGAPPLPSVSRRDLLAGGAATIACAFVPVTSLVLTTASAAGEVLTYNERQTLEAFVSRIIPADENGPGALEAGCARYIEAALAGAYHALTKTYRSGLSALNVHAMSKEGKSFAALTSTGQDNVLSDFERNTKVGNYVDSNAFFELVRRHTLEGMFGDPSYGGNANFVGWELIGYPGPRMFVSAKMQEMNAKIPLSRVSAKQLVHASR